MPYCDSYPKMATTKNLVRLIATGSSKQSTVVSFDRHQIPINIDENLIMKLQLTESYFTCYQGMKIQEKNYPNFLKSYQQLTSRELENTLCVSINQVREYIPRCVSCLGCRTSLDHFMKTIVQYRHRALEPIVLNENNCFTLNQSCYASSDALYSLLYIDGAKLQNFIANIPKCKKNRRCHLHSLDKTKIIHDWQIIWDMMDKECRDEITLVESDQLLDALENYLHKHRFCAECKLKVLEAYDLLINDPKHRERKGFCPALYQGLRSCSNDKHIHIQAEKEFLASLISRAEFEMEDTRRERHAKTLNIAQEEILTCLGIYLYERFEKIDRIIRSEQQTWQLLFYLIIDCLRLNFETIKIDLNMTMKFLCEEFSDKDLKKKSKKLKKKSRRTVKPAEVHRHSSDYPSIDYSLVNNEIDRFYSTPRRTLIQSQSCPALFSSPIEHRIPISSSLETLSSSISTRDCLCQEMNSQKVNLSTEEDCVTLSCIRCSSTRTDLGYSSELDDISSSGLCDCSLDKVEENCRESILSDDGKSSIDQTVINCTKTIELCDITRTPKLKLQLSDQYPFFNMDFKEIWDDPFSSILEETSFISDEDLQEFFRLHHSFDVKRAQLREFFKYKFHTWQQQLTSKSY